MKKIIAIVMLVVAQCLLAGVTVSDVEVFSGYPWKEVVVGYTIQGADSMTGLRLSATDKSTNKTYMEQLVMDAKLLTDGRHVLRWDASSEGVKIVSADVEFVVSAVEIAVQLWENGPYWAICNVGATKPEEYGYYFWWGDTVGYKRNAANDGWVSVKDGSSFSFSSVNCPTCSKGNSRLQSDGYIDSTGNLVAAYDAATAHLGAPWRMPTDAEFTALINNCDTEWTSRNGVRGRLVKGRGAYASKSIFLPAAGLGNDSNLRNLGSYGNYWSSTPDSVNTYLAWYLIFYSGDFYLYSYFRYDGRSVRPVRGFAQ